MSLENLDHKFREDYTKGCLSEEDVNPDPMIQFKQWFQDFVATGVRQPNAMVISTVDTESKPSSRVVLLKDVTDTGFVFFTNYLSSKGNDITQNKIVSLLFYSIELERQIRIEGRAEKLSYDESNTYFQSRPIDSQIAAMASNQSEVIASRAVLETQFDHYKQLHENKAPQCPDYWGGYCVIPHFFEFWQGRKNRFHDRICYTNSDKTWAITRKAP